VSDIPAKNARSQKMAIIISSQSFYNMSPVKLSAFDYIAPALNAQHRKTNRNTIKRNSSQKLCKLSLNYLLNANKQNIFLIKKAENEMMKFVFF
jgi:hypothetical protein